MPLCITRCPHSWAKSKRKRQAAGFASLRIISGRGRSIESASTRSDTPAKKLTTAPAFSTTRIMLEIGPVPSCHCSRACSAAPSISAVVSTGMSGNETSGNFSSRSRRLTIPSNSVPRANTWPTTETGVVRCFEMTLFGRNTPAPCQGEEASCHSQRCGQRLDHFPARELRALLELVEVLPGRADAAPQLVQSVPLCYAGES